jgi:sulfur carrier protein
MQLRINGEKREFLSVSVISDLLNQLGYEANKIAVAVDGEFVPRSQYSSRSVHDGEAIDIVAPVQGG